MTNDGHSTDSETSQQNRQGDEQRPRQISAARRLPPWARIGGSLVGLILCAALVGGVLLRAGAINLGGGAAAAPEEAAEAAEEVDEATLPGLTPVTRNADWEPVIQDFDGAEMALVPAGCFTMGSEDGDDDERPIRQVCFEEPFWIDVYEVTIARSGPPGSLSGDNRPQNERPRDTFDWFQAAAYCERRDARLPTEAEWEYAARGPDGLVYPWGNELVGDNVVYSGNSGNRTADVGSRPGGVSWVGAYDLSGNVREWVADWYGPYSSEAGADPTGPDSGDVRVLRGGSWLGDSGSLRSANRSWDAPRVDDHYSGFRCARDY